METLVATVLIVVVFMISSMILNNLFSNSIKNNTRKIEAYLNELEYLYKSEKLTVPYQDEFRDWQITIVTEKEFHVPLQDKILFFNGNQIELGLIDALKLETDKSMQNQHLFVFKDNDATLFVN